MGCNMSKTTEGNTENHSKRGSDTGQKTQPEGGIHGTSDEGANAGGAGDAHDDNSHSGHIHNADDDHPGEAGGPENGHDAEQERAHNAHGDEATADTDAIETEVSDERAIEVDPVKNDGSGEASSPGPPEAQTVEE